MIVAAVMDGGDAVQALISLTIAAGAIYATRRGVLRDKAVTVIEQETGRLALISTVEKVTAAAFDRTERQLATCLEKATRLEVRLDEMETEAAALREETRKLRAILRASNLIVQNQEEELTLLRGPEETP